MMDDFTSLGQVKLKEILFIWFMDNNAKFKAIDINI